MPLVSNAPLPLSGHKVLSGWEERGGSVLKQVIGQTDSGRACSVDETRPAGGLVFSVKL